MDKRAPEKLAGWLNECPAKRRKSQLPLASAFAQSPSSVSCLLPYAPEDLQCAVCFLPLLDMILDSPGQADPLSCPVGHFLCPVCFERVARAPSPGQRKCPLCAVECARFIPAPILRVLAPASLSMCPHGCGQALWGHQRRGHVMETCVRRRLICPQCDLLLEAREFVAHMREHVVADFKVQVFGCRDEGSAAPYVCNQVQGISRGLVYSETFRLYALEELGHDFSETLLIMDLWFLDARDCRQGVTAPVPARARVTLPYGPPEQRVVERVFMLKSWESLNCSMVIPSLPKSPGLLDGEIKVVLT